MEPLVDLAISVVNYNQKAMTVDCLRSILEAPPECTCEIYVVDNGSSDGSADRIAALFPTVRLIRNDANLGFAKAHNQVLRLDNSRYVLLLNNDTTLFPKTLDSLVAFMDAHPQAGLAGCRILNPDGTLQPSTYGSLSVAKTFLRMVGLRRLFPKGALWRCVISALPLSLQHHFPGYWQHDTVREVKSVMGAFFLMRREAVRQAGLLDETMFMYNEEGEWAYRARAAGWKVYFVPITGIIHYGGPFKLRKGFQPRLFVEKHKGLLHIFKKHHTPAEFMLAKWIIVSSFAFKLAFWFAAWPFSPANASLRIHTYREIIEMAYRF